MKTDSYFDIRNLTKLKGELLHCPITGCKSIESNQGYCPVHCINIHKKTFVYFNGEDPISKKDSALRNILFEHQYFRTHILGNTAKAESHRICHETSEDALTWNVFSYLARHGLLRKLLSQITKSEVESEPELYLWGLKISLEDSSKPKQFHALKNARDFFENGISRFGTEPDIILYIPGELLVLIEAKFTSGNTLAEESIKNDHDNEKPKSRKGILKRYSRTLLPNNSLLESTSNEPFYGQLYRNLVFAIHMANELGGVKWHLVNLVSKGQFDKHRKTTLQFQDPTQFIQGLLPEPSKDRFHFYSWEQLYSDHVANETGMNDLAEYMYYKSANVTKAFAID